MIVRSLSSRVGGAGLLCGETTRSVPPVNALFVIVPYRYEGMWVFDDPRVGLSREPFIAGIDTMIEKIVTRIPDADQGFRAIFSAAPFPGYTETLECLFWWEQKGRASSLSCAVPDPI
jgi:hypothetical protein